MVPHGLTSFVFIVDINRNFDIRCNFSSLPCDETLSFPKLQKSLTHLLFLSLSFKIPISKSDWVQTNDSKLFLRSDITLTCIRIDFGYLFIHHQFIVLWNFSSVNFQFRIPSSTSKLPAKWIHMTVWNCCTNKETTEIWLHIWRWRLIASISTHQSGLFAAPRMRNSNGRRGTAGKELATASAASRASWMSAILSCGPPPKISTWEGERGEGEHRALCNHRDGEHRMCFAAQVVRRRALVCRSVSNSSSLL